MARFRNRETGSLVAVDTATAAALSDREWAPLDSPASPGVEPTAEPKAEAKPAAEPKTEAEQAAKPTRKHTAKPAAATPFGN